MLPASVRALLEERVNGRGDLAVVAAISDAPRDVVPPVMRQATVAGEKYETFTYGQGQNFMTKTNIPLNGIAVPNIAAKPYKTIFGQQPKLLALSDSPARVLDSDEVNSLKRGRAAKAEPEPVCSVSQKPVNWQREETVVEIAGDLHSFCGKIDASWWANANIQAAGLDLPDGKGSIAGMKSSYTEGRKRMFCMRPYWSNYAPVLSTNEAITRYTAFSNYMWQMSYGKLVLAPLGKGSEISPDLLLPGLVAEYDNTGLGKLYNTCRDVAATNHGYDLSQFDFLYVMTGGQPAAGYCGLAFVGGVGFHIPCWGADVTSHEFGHNLGLNHAHFWDTSSQSIVGPGANVEYGDNNDPMGGGGNPNQYNSRYKNYLGWITNAEIATIPATGSNRYRLYCFDLDYGVGLRGLRFANPGPDYDYYWLNFRQRKTSSQALMNGAQLLWTDNNNGGSYLLDVRLRGSAGDNAIVIGRTFSDTNLNFHVTPIGKGNTYPESIDIVAVTGPQPGNLPPIASLSATTLTPSPLQSVTFTATASDPNGDALAYYWEFGDGADNYSFDNQPTQTHSFGSAGEYAVRCVVSDMRGGTAQHTLIVRVGNPNVFRISGHVVNERSQPLAGARVSAGSRAVFTDSDGSYIIPGLSAGSYSVSALEPVRDAVEFIHPAWANPVVLGPSAQHIDFIVGTGAPPSTLVATGANWKYFDKGTDPGIDWMMPLYADNTWSNGPSQLGYGENDESTRIEDNATPGYVASDTDRYISYYFRRSFNVVNPTSLTNVILSVLRDDGIAVYLNGTQIFRNNLAANATYLTLATNASDDGKTWLTANVPSSLLVAGANVIAAEVHQDSASSSDITFDLTLTTESIVNTQRATIVYIENPTDNASFTSPTNITITASAFGTPNSVTNVDIFDGATRLASIPSAPYSTTLTNPTDGLHVLRAISTDTTGLRRTSAPVNITVAAPAPPGPAVVTLPYLQTNALWRYRATNSTAPAGWQNIGFNDGTWSNGIARLGFNGATPSTNINTMFYGGPSNGRYPSAYFRAPFVVNDPAAITTLNLAFARDDGIVVYLNGAELFRDNMPEGAIAFDTLASGNAGDNGQQYFTYTYNVPLGALLVGTNVLAAEVHQSAANSSDTAFDLWLSGQATTNRSRGIWLTSPTNGSSVLLPGSAKLTAEVVAGGNLGIARVEFYSDGSLIGQDTSLPYSFNWTTPGGGNHVLTAVAIDSAGGSITSAPVNVNAPFVPNGEALVSFGDIWKYLDDGSDAVTTWKNSAFNDNQWMMGPGRLGYGGDGEVTTVSYGTNASFKYVTTYFRKKFVVANPATLNGLLMRLVRDDGIVVYINGIEAYRENLIAGPISYNSLADVAIGGSDEVTPLEVLLGTTNLVAGTNTIALEVHQDSITSSDLGFDLALIGYQNTNTAHGVYLTSPGNNSHFNMPASVALTANAASTNGAVTLVEYYAGAAKIGQSATVPYPATWAGPSAGTHLLTAVATYGGGLRMTSPPISIVVGAMPAPITPVFTQLINWGSQWRYWSNSAVVSNGWQSSLFDDSDWALGNARLGWGLDGESTLLTPRLTHYFRRAFTVANASALDSLTFNVLRDDGVVVYLNGIEVFRTNMPSGSVDGTTLASATVNTPDETIPVSYTLPTVAAALLNGTNVVAVELHQSSPTSSDAGFDLSLYAEGTTEPRIYLGSPANNSVQVFGLPMRLEANAQAGTGHTVTAVEFFSDGTNVGQATTFPYRVNWSGAPLGVHTIVARSIDDLGIARTSAPVQIRVGYQPVTLVLVPARSVWKYLDNGSNQGTNFAQTNFNDTTWLSGPGELGYGDLPDGNPESTVMCCSNVTTHPLTHYFRREFVVPQDTYLTNLSFRLLRDDGAVVWLNGREMYRSNMPNGAITYLTPASAGVTGGDEVTYFVTTLATTNAHSGTNLVAVEVHQNAATSSDLSFDLQVEGEGYALKSSGPIALAISDSGGEFRIVWPASATGYQLYWSQQVGPGASWQLVGTTPTSSNGLNVVIIPATNPAAFYRLQKP